MNTSQHRKAWLLFFSLLAVGAVVVLVSGIATLDLDAPTQPLPRMPPPEGAPPEAAPGVAQIADTVLNVLFAVGGALLPFAILYYLFSPGGRKRVLRDLIAFLVLLTPLYLLWRAQLGAEPIDGLPLQPEPSTGPGPAPAPNLAFAPQPPPWLSWVATGTVAFLLAALLVGAGWVIWHRRRRPAASLDRLARQAEDAIEAIEAGADLKDTVTRCYFEMMQVLKEERNIQRPPSLTPREFEAHLEQIGMPTTQVRRLTRLFEDVRYGDRQLGKQEERQAVVALSFIARFCRGAP